MVEKNEMVKTNMNDRECMMKYDIACYVRACGERFYSLSCELTPSQYVSFVVLKFCATQNSSWSAETQGPSSSSRSCLYKSMIMYELYLEPRTHMYIP